MSSFMIGDRFVGDGYAPYVVAEIGINHGGSLAMSYDMIDAAVWAGCDAVKFQNYKTESFFHQRSENWTYTSQGKEITERQFDMFKRCELAPYMLGKVFEYACEKGIGVHSTPMCRTGLDELLALDVTVLKNGSDCLQDLDLIRAMGETGLPTVISTGMATGLEIANAVEAFDQTGNQKLVLLHCTSAYPCPDSDANVCRVRALRNRFDCLTGFSDHTRGITAAVLSVAYDSCWIEKHFTVDKDLPGPDHQFSADPEEMRLLVNAVRAASEQIGDSRLGMTKLEKANRKAWFK